MFNEIDYAKFKFYLMNELGSVYDLGYGAGYTKIQDNRELISDFISDRIISMLNTCTREEDK